MVLTTHKTQEVEANLLSKAESQAAGTAEEETPWKGSPVPSGENAEENVAAGQAVSYTHLRAHET